METKDLEYAAFACFTFSINCHDRCIGRQGTAGNPAYADHAEVARIIQGRNLHLEGLSVIDLRRADVVHDGLQDRLHAFLHVVRIVA